MRIFNIFKRKKSKHDNIKNNINHDDSDNLNNSDNLKSYTFIWYKKIQVGRTTHYTAPFRTTCKGKTREEAREKAINFAMQSMILVIMDEKDFKYSDLMKFNEKFNELNKEFNETINNIFKH